MFHRISRHFVIWHQGFFWAVLHCVYIYWWC